jgi:hypothetical protein
MSDRRTELGFERTVCDCKACKINCEFIPGFLLPSDIRRIALHLGYSNPVEFALDNLLASPGAIVVDRGHIRRIRTLAPARRLVIEAAEQRVSLNQWINTKLALPATMAETSK